MNSQGCGAAAFTEQGVAMISSVLLILDSGFWIPSCIAAESKTISREDAKNAKASIDFCRHWRQKQPLRVLRELQTLSRSGDGRKKSFEQKLTKNTKGKNIAARIPPTRRCYSRKREAPVVPGTTGGQPLMGISLIENINCLNGEFMSLRKL